MEVLIRKQTNITVQMIRDKIAANVQRDVDGKLRETHGKNRSPRIDSFNKRCGVPMGSPYCMSGAWCAIDDACKQLGITNPVPATAGSQKGYYQAPAKYQKKSWAKKGDLAIYQNKGNKAQGHAMILREDMLPNSKTFLTVEYNTAPSGTRDGDGAYALTRSTLGTSTKTFRGFVDVAQWIFDSNFVTKVKAAA